MPLVTRTSGNASVFKDTTEPSDKSNGNIWMDTNDSPASLSVADGSNYVDAKVKVGSQAVPVGALI